MNTKECVNLIDREMCTRERERERENKYRERITRRYRLGRLKVLKMCALTTINPHCCICMTFQNARDKTTIRLY